MTIYPVVMAGGWGSRFWPLSRRKRPKQFLPLLEGGDSLFERTVDRLKDVYSIEQIHVVAPAAYRDKIREAEPELPSDQLIPEPVPRDTACCSGLAAMTLQEKDRDAAMMLLPSDQLIDGERFSGALRNTEHAIDRYPESLLCLGVEPAEPAPGYGYIQPGEHLMEFENANLFRAEHFVEKPDRSRARDLIDQGEALWNTGIFGWKTETFLDEFEKYAPDLHGSLQSYVDRRNPGEVTREDREQFRKLRATSVDYAVLQPSDRINVLNVSLDWSDIGSLDVLRDLSRSLTGEGAEESPAPVTMGVKNSIFYNTREDHLLAGLGVEDVIVVQTEDVTLVVPEDRVQEVRDLVEKVSNANLEEYL